MVKTSRWMQVIPTLAGLLLALLLVAGAVIWSTGGAPSGDEAQLGRLMALAQAARDNAAAASSGDQAALEQRLKHSALREKADIEANIDMDKSYR